MINVVDRRHRRFISDYKLREELIQLGASGGCEYSSLEDANEVVQLLLYPIK